MRRSDLAALAAAALVLYTVATRNGMSVWPDTVAYREMAEAIRAGSDPGPNFPPLFPLVLAITGSERVINGVCFAVAVVLTAIAVWRESGHRLAALLAGSIAITAPPALGIFTTAQSEPLYVALMLGGLIANSGLLIGLGCVTRYAGLPILAIGLARTRPLRFALPAVLPLALVLAKNWMRSGAPTNREAHVRMLDIGLLSEGAANITHWIVPMLGATPLRYAVAGAVIALLIRNARHLFAQAALAHLAFLWAANAILDAAIIFDDRLLLPFFSLALPVCAIAGARARHGLFLLSAAALLSALRCAYGLATDDFERLLFNAPKHRTSETLRFVRELSPEARVIANGHDLIRFQTARASIALPETIGFTTGLARPAWCEELRALTRDRETWIVWLEAAKFRDNVPTPEAAGACVRLDPPRTFSDGAAFRVVR